MGGNITSKKTYAYTTGTLGTAISTQTYSYTDSNWKDKLTAINGSSITYDNSGNPLSYYNGSSYTFTWTQGRQLATAVKGSNTLSFSYNENGIRTYKTVNGVKHEYVVDGTRIIAEKWGASGVRHFVTYLYDANGVIGMAYRTSTMSSGEYEVYIFDKNLQGDITAVYSVTGTLLVQYKYDAWGNVTTSYINGGASTGAQYNAMRYRGYYYDSETGFYYLNSRYYDPATGRFLNADIYINANGDLSGYNMFAYCSNNPVSYVDPLGCRSKFFKIAFGDAGLSGYLWAINEAAAIGERAIISEGTISIDMEAEYNNILRITEHISLTSASHLMAYYSCQKYEKNTGKAFLLSDLCVSNEIQEHIEAYYWAIGDRFAPNILALGFMVSMKNFDASIVYRATAFIDMRESDVKANAGITSQASVFGYKNGIRDVYIGTERDPWAEDRR